MRNRFRGFISFFVAIVLIINVLSVSEASAASSVYKEDQLLYWRIDGGKDLPTIKLRTENVPMNFTYTQPLESSVKYDETDGVPVMSYDAIETDYEDKHPGTKESYGKTLLKARMLRVDAGAYVNNIYINKDQKWTDRWNMVSDPDLREVWGMAVYHDIAATGERIYHKEKDGSIVYNFTGPTYELPDVLVTPDIIDYRVEYSGNAILIPAEQLEYYTNVQGTLVEVTSDDNLRLEYAIENSSKSAVSATY